jgi:hypothetical protein
MQIAEEAYWTPNNFGLIIVTLHVDDVRTNCLGARSSTSLISGEWEYWNADSTTQDNSHVRPQPKETRTIEQELDIGRVGVLE